MAIIVRPVIRKNMATLNKKSKAAIAQRLGHHLADTMILYVKTLNFHWNMVGPQFFMYHRLLEEQYKELAQALDELAERIRMLGFPAPGSLIEFQKLGCLKEGKAKTQATMVQELVSDHEAMIEHSQALIALCNEAGDEGTADLIIERLRSHDKAAWLLRSHTTSGPSEK